MTRRLQFCEIWRKMSGPGGATNATPGPEQRQPVREVATMPDGTYYTDSVRSGKTEQSEAAA